VLTLRSQGGSNVRVLNGKRWRRTVLDNGFDVVARDLYAGALSTGLDPFRGRAPTLSALLLKIGFNGTLFRGLLAV
jgi:hypothetical protein